MTAKWQSAHTYVPGSLVAPATSQVQPPSEPDNAGFESGDLTGWITADPSRWTVINDAAEAYSGNCYVRVSGDGLTSLASDTRVPVKPGQQVTVTAFAQIVNAGTDDASCRVVLEWRDAAGNLLAGYIPGNLISGKGGVWKPSTASGPAPAGVATYNISLSTNTGSHGSIVEWDATGYADAIAPIPAGLVFRATQAAPGKSGTSEPTWPTTTGVEVTDNEVTWEGVIATRLVWEASPLLKSGATEPAWPAEEDGVVHDGTIDWHAFTPQAKDAPSSAIVTVGANKVFVGDGDIVRFCATNDALDWDKQADAGYLPTGLWAVGETECTALGIYRGNLTAWTASSMQVWQIDPDPARMSIIDTVEGAGASFVRANTGMMNDLYFLSRLGVRSVGVTATTGTMAATDVGSPVDPLVRASLASLGATIDPLTVFYANASQLWQFLGNTAYVYAVSAGSKVFAWSEYTFPWTVTDACVLNGELYVRTADHDVFVLDPARFSDDAAGGASRTQFTVEVQWPWHDLGSPGVEKMLDAVDAVVDAGSATETAITIGYDERDESAFTEAITIGGDTRPGDPVPVPAAAVSMAPKLTHTSDEPWSVSALTLYYYPMGPYR